MQKLTQKLSENSLLITADSNYEEIIEDHLESKHNQKNNRKVQYIKISIQSDELPISETLFEKDLNDHKIGHPKNKKLKMVTQNLFSVSNIKVRKSTRKIGEMSKKKEIHLSNN